MKKYIKTPSNLDRTIHNYLKTKQINRYDFVKQVNKKIKDPQNRIFISNEEDRLSTIEYWMNNKSRPKNPETRAALLETLKITHMHSIFNNGVDVAQYLLKMLDHIGLLVLNVADQIDKNKVSRLTKSLLLEKINDPKEVPLYHLHEESDIIDLFLQLSERLDLLYFFQNNYLDSAEPITWLKANECIDNKQYTTMSEEKCINYLKERGSFPLYYGANLKIKEKQYILSDKAILNSLAIIIKSQAIPNFNYALENAYDDPSLFAWQDVALYRDFYEYFKGQKRTKHEDKSLFLAGLQLLHDLFNQILEFADQKVESKIKLHGTYSKFTAKISTKNLEDIFHKN